MAFFLETHKPDARFSPIVTMLGEHGQMRREIDSPTDSDTDPIALGFVASTSRSRITIVMEFL